MAPSWVLGACMSLQGVGELEPRGTDPCSADSVLEWGAGKSERALPGKGSESWVHLLSDGAG